MSNAAIATRIMSINRLCRLFVVITCSSYLSARLEACGVVQRPIALSSSQAQNGNNVMNDKRSRLADTEPGPECHREKCSPRLLWEKKVSGTEKRLSRINVREIGSRHLTWPLTPYLARHEPAGGWPGRGFDAPPLTPPRRPGRPAPATRRVNDGIKEQGAGARSCPPQLPRFARLPRGRASWRRRRR